MGKTSSCLGHPPWASCQIGKIACAHAPGMPGRFSPPPRVSDPDMHHGTCVTHVPWCMPGSLNSPEVGGGGKRSRHSWRMRNLQFYLSGKRPIGNAIYTDEATFKLHQTPHRWWSSVHWREGERGTLMSVCRQDGNIGPSAIVWAGCHYGSNSEQVVLDSTMNQQVSVTDMCCNKVSYAWQKALSQNNLSQSNIMLHPYNPSH